ncbi:MAG: hypothetical protein LBG43_11525 [Treponema sp.]|nr:hypothetical protein [Treponema sp.]
MKLNDIQPEPVYDSRFRACPTIQSGGHPLDIQPTKFDAVAPYVLYCLY